MMKKILPHRDYYGLILGELVCFNAISDSGGIILLFDGRTVVATVKREKWALLGMCNLEVELWANGRNLESELFISSKGEQIAMRDQFLQGRNGPLNGARKLSSLI
jgi:hypothetical protein